METTTRPTPLSTSSRAAASTPASSFSGRPTSSPSSSMFGLITSGRALDRRGEGQAARIQDDLLAA